MGLSASQARLLSLTARQSNLEFEGQQINQQRTTLSNQSSNYYNSLLEMDVPVPPSSDDYTKIVYTFTIGGNEATVKEALPENQKNGTATYTVSYTTNLSTIGIKENSAYKTSASSSKTAKNIVSNGNAAYDENKSYYLAAMNRLDATSTVAADEQYVMLDSMPNPKPANLVVIGKNGYQIDADKYAAMSKEDQELCKIYRKANDTTDTAAQKYALSYN